MKEISGRIRKLRKEKEVEENIKYVQIKGRGQKNAAKVWSFTKPEGVSEGNKKPNPFFWKSIFFSELVESF
ncbi:MAG: hypothetical protein QF406_15170 [Verrucomicrobiota bacterium]|nr:hypothetical protein [Verrucomicrobiota bacterium]